MSKSREKQSREDAAATDASATGESVEAATPEEDSPEVEDTGAAETNRTGEVERIAELEEQVADLNDALLRKQADFENFRKRMFREREETAKYANSALLLDLVEIIDNFERAIKSSEESQDFVTFHQGIELIEKQFLSMLESKYGLKRFESEGTEFDPEKHEAIAVDQESDHDVQTVVEDYQKGYMLHDRVLRHAKVKVAMPTAEPASTESEQTDSTAQ